MSNGTSDGERRDDSFVERLGDRISATPPPAGRAPTPPRAGPPKMAGPPSGGVRLGGPAAVPVLGPGDFNAASSTTPGGFKDESTALSRESEPPPPLTGELPPPAEGSGLFDAMPQPPPSRPDDAFSEFEASEMPGESTRIEESEVIADQSTAILDEGPKMPFLWVESGKDKNKEYVLQEGETGVGRGIDNDVILTDVSVSRKHLRVLRDGSSLVLRDLGSGNGTTVNGQRVHQVTLNEGDRIELGETVLVVRYPDGKAQPITSPNGTRENPMPAQHGAPPAMIPAWPSAALPPPASGSQDNVAPRDGHTATVRLPRRTLALAVAGIAAVALMMGVGVGAILLVAGRSTETPAPLPVATPVLPAVTGVPAVGGPPVSTAPSVLPSPVTGVPVPATGVAVAPPTYVMAPPATGVPVPPTSVAMAPPVTGVPVPAVPVPATTVAVAPAAPTTTEPEPEPESATATGTSSRGGRPTRGGRAPRESASSGVASAQARVTTAYNAGDFDGAAAIARDAARHASGSEQRTLETLANNIDSFASFYPRIQRAGDALGPVAGSIPIALRLDRQIVSGGHYAREIQPRYVRYLVSQARSQIGSAPQTACPRVREVLDLESGNGDAQALARQCETAAARMLSDAQSRERSDAAGAQRTYQQIQQMVPRTSATFRTAGERLSALRTAAPATGTTRPRRPVDEDE